MLPAAPLHCAEPWTSEPFALTPGCWYRFRCRAHTPGRAYWAVRFFDDEGAELADHYDGIEAGDGWRDEGGCFRAKHDAVAGRLVVRPLTAQGITVADAGVETVSRAHVRSWAEAIARELPDPPTDPPAPPDLPGTRRRLAEGAGLRVLVLGDSIMNDVANAPWDVLLDPPDADERAAGRVTVLSGCVGSARFSAYLEDGLYRWAVARHEPDLIAMAARGGRGDGEGLAALLRRLEADSDAERLVLTDPFGIDGDPRATLDWTPPAEWPPDPDDALARVAAAHGAAFFNLRGAWRGAIGACAAPYEQFLRDIHHANFRGRVLVAQLLVRALAPSAARGGSAAAR